MDGLDVQKAKVTDGNDCKTSKTLDITNATSDLAKALFSHFFRNKIVYIK